MITTTRAASKLLKQPETGRSAGFLETQVAGETHWKGQCCQNL